MEPLPAPVWRLSGQGWVRIKPYRAASRKLAVGRQLQSLVIPQAGARNELTRRPRVTGAGPSAEDMTENARERASALYLYRTGWLHTQRAVSHVPKAAHATTIQTWRCGLSSRPHRWGWLHRNMEAQDSPHKVRVHLLRGGGHIQRPSPVPPVHSRPHRRGNVDPQEQGLQVPSTSLSFESGSEYLTMASSIGDPSP